jgi:UDP-N-acetylglucosamine kinase
MTTMTEDEQRIYDAAVEYARTNKKARCAALTDPRIYLPEQDPVSVFMAGSAG